MIMNKIDMNRELISKIFEHKKYRSRYEVEGVSDYIPDRVDLLYVHNVSNDDIPVLLTKLSKRGMIVCESFNADTVLNPKVCVRLLVDIPLYIITQRPTQVVSGGIVEATSTDYLSLFDDVVLCGIAKLEKDYIYDWVDYHIKLGYDRVVLYDNNDEGVESYDDLLVDFKQVEIRHRNGIPGIQIPVYEEYYNESEFAWCTIIDIDEFMTIEQDSIQQLIEQYEDVDIYLLPWLIERARPISDDSPIYTYDNPITKPIRRTGDHNILQSWFKSTYRSGLEGNLDEHFMNDLKSVVVYNGFHDTVMKRNIDEVQILRYNRECILRGETPKNSVRHYITRDIKTFLETKYMRGHAGWANSGLNDYFSPLMWSQNMMYFTDVNNPLTSEEMRYIENIGFRLNPQFIPTVVLIYDKIVYDTEYYDRMDDLLRKLGNYADFIELIRVGYNTPLSMTQVSSFSNSSYTVFDNFDLPQTDSTEWCRCNLRKQDLDNALILHIGYPDMMPIQEYLNILSEHLLNPDVFTMACKYLKINNPTNSILYTCNDIIQHSHDCLGWYEQCDEYCLARGVENKHMRIVGNTLLTNISTWNNLCEISGETKESNTDILQYIQDKGITSMYHKFSFDVCNSVEKVMVV